MHKSTVIIFVDRLQLSKRLGLPEIGAEVLPRYTRADGLEQGWHAMSWIRTLLTSCWHQRRRGKYGHQTVHCIFWRYKLYTVVSFVISDNVEEDIWFYGLPVRGQQHNPWNCRQWWNVEGQPIDAYDHLDLGSGKPGTYTLNCLW